MPNSDLSSLTTPQSYQAEPGLLESLREIHGLLEQALLADHIRIGARIERALRRARQGLPVSLPVARWKEQIQASINLRLLRAKLAQRVSYPPELPITAYKDQILELIRLHQTIIVAGDTGSGKSTQLPKICLEAGLGQRGRIGCTQPRRLAALAISQRLAEELNVRWGYEVGCKIRFNDYCRPETSIKVMTDGILLAEIRTDPYLTEYDTIIVDEAHERSLNIDFILGHLRNIIKRRTDLKLIITSATLNIERFAEAFKAPVVTVSGRLYPIEIRYLSEQQVKETVEEIGYVETAIRTALELIYNEPAGDILIFMPTERDIRESCETIKQEVGEEYEVLPLFARLSASEQSRIFNPGLKPRIIVATNIAETSLTVPRIRYVIDTGLARISRYNPSTRTHRLPIEPISQSSAKQRAGRCGRTAGGLCIRLYTEQDYESRPKDTEPEILRANLADVVLRLKAFDLGDPETFPFLDPPKPALIHAAYNQLRELGALDSSGKLTPLGRDLAFLPIDPAIGRMVIEARRRNALREVLIIAAGLAIQDPREVPYDQRELARRMQTRFDHPASDFLTLLNIWNAYHNTWQRLKTERELRRFCRQHFLSYARMREWIDLHEQLLENLREIGGFVLNDKPPTVETIHRCILAGFLGHIARRVEPNTYIGPNNRKVYLHPSSVFFLHTAREHRQSSVRSSEVGQPEWIVAGEIIETDRCYARIVAPIKPEWVQELAPHLCRASYVDPRWDSKNGTVVVTEQILFRGLVLSEQTISYRKVYPQRAKEIFVQKALIDQEGTPHFAFILKNKELLRRLRYWQSRLNRRLPIDLEQRLFEFYMAKLPDIGSIDELQHFLRQHGEQSLVATHPVLLGEFSDWFDPTLFPDTVQIANRQIKVEYRYEPEDHEDWVQVTIPIDLVPHVTTEELQWSIPTLREQFILWTVQRLPKAVTSKVESLHGFASAIARQIICHPADFLAELAHTIKLKLGIQAEAYIPKPEDWPEHLRLRIRIVDSTGKVLAEGFSVEKLRCQLHAKVLAEQKRLWIEAASRHERYGLQEWSIGDQPEQILIGSQHGLPIYAYPGLYLDEEGISLRLFANPQDAALATQHAVPVLGQKVLSRHLVWCEKQLSKELRGKAGPLYATLDRFERLQSQAWASLLKYAFPPPTHIPPLRQSLFNQYLAQAQSRLQSGLHKLPKLVASILEQRLALELISTPYPGMKQELDALVPPDFLVRVPFERLEHLPRYLKAIEVRAQRAKVNPAKDREKAARLLPVLKSYNRLASEAGPNPLFRKELEKLRWLIEELKVLSFAPELGVAERVSEAQILSLIDSLAKKINKPAPPDQAP